MCDFNKGDRIKFAGGKGKITEIEERPGDQADLLHIYTDEGELKKRPCTLPSLERLASPIDQLISKEFDSPVRYELREQATQLDLAYQYDRFLSLTSNRIEIEPYQVKAAYEILQSHDHRYLIADEVGLGKTIEAGIVIEELIARGRAERVLIITPAPLQAQWQQEMQDKFDRNFVIYDRGYVRAQREAHPNQNVWIQENQIITSIDFAKQDDLLEALRNLEVEWDIAVFDESHHLTARRSGDGVDRTERYKVGEAVAQNTDALLLLTGTPHKGKSDQFYFMIRLLDPYRFRNEQDITPDQLDDLMIRRLKDNMYESDGTRMFPKKNIETLPVDFTPQERELYRDVTDYIRDYYNLAQREDNQAAGFAMVIYQKRLVSSIYAIRESLKNRVQTIQEDALNEELPDDVADLLPTYGTEPETLTDEQRQRVEQALSQMAVATDPDRVERELELVKGLWEQAKEIDIDSKAQKLREFVDGILQKDPDEKVLIFTEYTDTLEYLRDEVFEEFDVAQIHGDISQERRRQEQERFRQDVNLMVATDAAREGLNLQFAHIMVNYDLPWNPIRIDQRMGRLHRYGQEHTVQIRNLFVNDTRESDILETLVGKLETIEEELGVSSDVLGLVLEDFDLEQTIMESIAQDDEPEEVVAEIDSVIDERKEALETVEQEFLIRDQFGLSEEDEEIESVIDRSREEAVGEADIETLVHRFFDEFGGSIKGMRPGPAREEGDLFQIEVPDVLSGNNVEQQYTPATFTQKIARENEETEFIALDHPLVQSIIDYCLDAEQTGGQSAVVVPEDPSVAPGILFNYRLSYISGGGETVTEEFVPLYATPENEDPDRADPDVEVTRDAPSAVSGVLPEFAAKHPEVEQMTAIADTLQSAAEAEAWTQVQVFAEEAREEREREVEIKREHAERYFDSRIETWQERLETYQERDRREETDMSPAIGRAKSELQDLKQEQEEELARLEEEQIVEPEEPQLVSTAIVVGQDIALDLQNLETGDLSTALEHAVHALKEGERAGASDPYREQQSLKELGYDDLVRVERNVDLIAEKNLDPTDCGGEVVYLPPDVDSTDVNPDHVGNFRQLIQRIIQEMGGNPDTVNICLTDEVIDGFNVKNQLFFNLALHDRQPEIYWYVVAARELAYNEHQSHSQAHMRAMTNYLVTTLEGGS